MSNTQFDIRVGAYYDSIVLMQLQKALADLPGILDAGVVMATKTNCDLLRSTGFDLSKIKAKADDLLIAVTAESEHDALEALGQVDELLKRRGSTAAQDFKPRSLRSAANMLSEANWVLISVPGRYAADVAADALGLNKHVFLYSDNVSIEDEIRLKKTALQSGLLVMGPDCGTAIINGVGFGFANRVRSGNIGIVAASGTGLQAVAATIHNLGAGISQAIGTGGRDLQAEVGGICAKQAIHLLGRDPQTEVIVLISKPPDVQVATELLAIALATEKPIVINFIGYADPGGQIGELHFVSNLKEAAEKAVTLIKKEEGHHSAMARKKRSGDPGHLRALFSGGTLAYEALLIMQTVLFPIYSNTPIRPEQQLADSLVSEAHTILDLGEDEFTQGRLHPMMDNDLRLRRLRQEVDDSSVSIIMLDIVLGEGAHPDPAAEFAPAIEQARRTRDIEFVIIVLGTDEDPQDIDRQIDLLESVGAIVFRETSDAASYVLERLRSTVVYGFPPVAIDQFEAGQAAINVGLESFYDSIKDQGARAVQVDWRPPAGGNEQLMAVLAKLRAT